MKNILLGGLALAIVQFFYLIEKERLFYFGYNFFSKILGLANKRFWNSLKAWFGISGLRWVALETEPNGCKEEERKKRPAGLLMYI